MQFENKILIIRPVSEVFAYFSDLGNMPKWNYYLEEVTMVDPEFVGVGTKYFQRRKTDQQHLVMTEYEQDQKVVVETQPVSKPFIRRSTEFTQLDGGTRVHDTFYIKTIFPGFIVNLFNSYPRNAVYQNLTKLKELLDLQDGREVIL